MEEAYKNFLAKITLMLVHGKQIILYLLKYHVNMIQKIYICKKIDKDLYHKMMQEKFELIRTKVEFVQQLCPNKNHQGFLAEVDELSPIKQDLLKHMQRIVVLAGLTDMGNIGAIIRSSFAMGIDALIIGALKSLNIKDLVRTSSGTIFDLPIVHIPNINDLPNMLRQFNFTLYGANMDGEDVKKTIFAKKSALFVGQEDEGLPNKLLKVLDKTVSIKMSHCFNSLNVSAATAILIHEMR